MKIGMHIFFACTQDGYKHIHVSRVTYERLAQVHSPASVVGSPHLLTLFACAVRCTHVYLACIKLTVQSVAAHRLFFDLQVVTLLLVELTCLHVQISLPYYQATFVFFNNTCSTLKCVYAYDGM